MFRTRSDTIQAARKNSTQGPHQIPACFKRLLAELSVQFINLPSEEVDGAINDSLRLHLRTSRAGYQPVIAALRSLARWASTSPGCLSALLYLEDRNSRHIGYVEAWKSEGALRQMIRSPHFSQLTSLMELATEAPRCEFRVIAETRGLEFPARVLAVEDEAQQPLHRAMTKQEPPDEH